MSRLEAGRRYRRVYCLTLGICYDDAVLMLCWGCGRPGGRTGEGGRDRGGDGGRRREKRVLLLHGENFYCFCVETL